MGHAVAAVQAQKERLGPLFQSTREADIGIVAPQPDGPIVLVTDTVVVDGANKPKLAWLRSQFGLEELRAGLQGKVLLKAPVGGDEGRKLVFEAAKAACEMHNVAAHPNFVRMLTGVKPSRSANQPLWNHDNTGTPGLPGADVAARAAWVVTQGQPEIRVAVLDEGVDTSHPALDAAVVEQKDYVDGNSHARPDGNDAHGTACAGIIFSRDATYPGLASACSLVAVRIAKGDEKGHWVAFDDYDTADSIDWAWHDARADVISCSWCGGPAVDVMTRAIDRALTKGRKGKGAVVVFAAGNDDGPVQFPATLEQVITVGASNQWDERKSRKSKDRETWWGSNYGKPLDLIAPGVRIATTDIQGAPGYSPDDFTLTFNGTSAATSHVAAAAALILALRPGLNERAVSTILSESTDRLTKSAGWDKYVGFGRLNIFAALRLARRWTR
jgi:subtilisin family serine protease